MRIATSRSQIWIPEIEYYQKVSSCDKTGPQEAEKQLRKLYVGGGGLYGGDYYREGLDLIEAF